MDVVVGGRRAVAGSGDTNGGKGFAGERRLVDVQVLGLEQQGIRRHETAAGQEDDVARYDVGCGDHRRLAVAQDANADGEALLQGGHGV